MAQSILEQYGIKEVADLFFYEIGDDGEPTVPVLFLDTLKMTTTEQTAEQADATGGKGNAPLITWDFGKEITVSVEDALFSSKSMAVSYGHINADGKPIPTEINKVVKTEQIVAKETSLTKLTEGETRTINGVKYEIVGTPTVTKEDGTEITVTSGTATVEIGTTYFITFDAKVEGFEIVVSANTFPGVYYVIGETFARAFKTGKDEFFQIVFPKAKITSENTITMEAEGDPSVFSMNLRVLRGGDGQMMKLIRYNPVTSVTPTP